MYEPLQSRVNKPQHNVNNVNFFLCQVKQWAAASEGRPGRSAQGYLSFDTSSWDLHPSLLFAGPTP